MTLKNKRHKFISCIDANNITSKLYANFAIRMNKTCLIIVRMRTKKCVSHSGWYIFYFTKCFNHFEYDPSSRIFISTKSVVNLEKSRITKSNDRNSLRMCCEKKRCCSPTNGTNAWAFLNLCILTSYTTFVHSSI